jgi:hypothetical protein
VAGQEAQFSSKDVQDVAGLSYRQINDWDARGVLPNDREGAGSWRRFTAKELFTVIVCAELRRHFGVSLSRLNYVREIMGHEEKNFLTWAYRLMVMLGVEVWLLTDLEKTFIMDSELEFLDLMGNGFFSGESERGYLFLKVSPLVNRLVEAIPDVEPAEAHGLGYEIMRRDEGTHFTREEVFVLESLRRPEFSRVEVILNNGEIKTIKTEEKQDSSSTLRSLLSQHGYQELTIVQKNGRVVSIKQQAVHKPHEL